MPAMATIQDAPQESEPLKYQVVEMPRKPKSSAAGHAKASDITKKSSGLVFNEANELYEAKFGGRLMVDHGRVSDKNGSANISAFALKSARITATGKIHHTINYKMTVDFAGNKVSFKDVHLQYSASGYNVTIGQSKEPISQDGQAGKTNSAFMERTSIASVAGLTHQLGLAVDFGGDNWGWKTGLYGGSLNGDNKGALTIATRAVYGGTMDKATWGIAASFRFRDAYGQDDYQYRVKAYNNFSPYYLDTAKGSQKDTFYGLDAAYTGGRFHASVEVGQLTAKGLVASDENLRIDTGYVEAGYFLTGEERVYDLRKGKWKFSEVISPFFGGGSGAIQAVARYDIIDMSGEAAIAGGNQKTLLLGVNWWLNNSTRFLINYNNTQIKNGFVSGLNDNQGANSVNGLGLRLVTSW